MVRRVRGLGASKGANIRNLSKLGRMDRGRAMSQFALQLHERGEVKETTRVEAKKEARQMPRGSLVQPKINSRNPGEGGSRSKDSGAIQGATAGRKSL